MFGNRACREVESLLWSYAARRVSEEDIERVEAHLKTCAQCREQAEGYRQTLGALTAYRGESVPLSQTNWQDLQARLAPERPAPAGFRWGIPTLAWGGIGAAVAAGALLFVLSMHNDRAQPGITFKPAPDTELASSGSS